LAQGLIDDIPTCAELIEKIVDDAAAVLRSAAARIDDE
jgi:hypothetical protein